MKIGFVGDLKEICMKCELKEVVGRGKIGVYSEILGLGGRVETGVKTYSRSKVYKGEGRNFSISKSLYTRADHGINGHCPEYDIRR